ncbi:MAG: hypothetical protein JWR75_1132 [Devosia sp.]|nr:hypothetical protein [Devosia sp.]
MSRPPEPRLEASVRLDTLPATGKAIEIKAESEQRAEIAASLGVTSVDSLVATVTALPFRGGIRAQGRLLATVIQPSVITLEPITQQIDEVIDRVFLPGREKDYAGPANAEIFVDLEGDDLPDNLVGGVADLSELIIETLALAIDPYPREPDAELPAAAFDSDGAEEHPFARLIALKDKL